MTPFVPSERRPCTICNYGKMFETLCPSKKYWAASTRDIYITHIALTRNNKYSFDFSIASCHCTERLKIYCILHSKRCDILHRRKIKLTYRSIKYERIETPLQRFVTKNLGTYHIIIGYNIE